MGMMRAFFQMSGICALAIEILKILVRYEMPWGPRCLRWRMVSPSGPVAVEFLHCLIVAAVLSSEKGARAGSNLCSCLTWRRVRRRIGSLEWVLTLVNCLVNCLAIAEGLEYVLLVPLWFLKEMGWFGGILILLPVRALILSQNLLTLVR